MGPKYSLVSVEELSRVGVRPKTLVGNCSPRRQIPCYTVDEIEVIFKDTVVELFGVDAQSSFIGTRGQKVHCKIDT